MDFEEESQITVNLSLSRFRLNSLRSMGLYPISSDANIILRMLYKLYSALSTLISVTLVVFRFVYLFSKSNLLESLSSGSSLTTAYTMVLLKSSIFKCTIEKNMKVLNMVENSWKRHYLRRNCGTIYRIIKETEGSISRITYASCSIMVVTYVLFSAAPMLSDYMDGSAIGTKMTIDIWLPFESKCRTGRMLTYGIERILNFYICCTMLALVNLYVHLLTLVAAEFKILKIDFMNFANEHSGVRFCQMERDKLVSFRLKRNVEKHQKLLGICKDVNEVLTPIFLLMVGSELFIISLSVYEVSLDPLRNTQHIGLLLIAIFHTLMYFWCCHQITFHSRELCEAAYFSKWWKLPKKYRTCLLIVMQRSNRPVVFRASKVCSMSLNTFVTLMKTSYSYFAVLRTLHAAHVPGQK